MKLVSRKICTEVVDRTRTSRYLVFNMKADLSITEVRVGDIIDGASYGVENAVVDSIGNTSGTSLRVVVRDGKAKVEKTFGGIRGTQFTVIKDGRPVFGKIFGGTLISILK
jgi:hypothetical protein